MTTMTTTATTTDTPRHPFRLCSTHVLPTLPPPPSAACYGLSSTACESVNAMKSGRKWAWHGLVATPENFFCHFHYFRMRRAELEAFHFYNYFSSCVCVCSSSPSSSSPYTVPLSAPSATCPCLILFCPASVCLPSVQQGVTRRC